MPELIIRTARLVPYAKRPKQVPSYVTAYTYEPLADEPGAALGNLFIVVEVLVSGRAGEEVADLVIETLGSYYYDRAEDETEPLQRFEAAVKATNHELAEYVNQGNAAWIGKLSAIAAVQVGSELHLAHTGSAEAFLYRGKAAARISGNQGPVRPAVPSKTFGSIASGALEAGDRLLLATPALIHQLSLTKLRDIIGGTSPSSAIAEITQLLRGSTSERIAALVVEVTTPELAALQVRSEEPNEIQLGSPDNVLEAAKLAAAPLAQATVTSGKRAHALAKTGWNRTRPHMRKAGLSAVAALRRFLTGPGAKQRVIIGGAVLVVLISATWYWQAGSARTKQLTTRYDQDYRQYQLALGSIANGDKATAKDLLSRLKTELADLHKASGRGQLDSSLKQRHQSEGQPASVADLVTLVSSKLDQIEGLRHVDPLTVASFSGIKNSKPTHFELNGGKAYVFDANNKSALYVVNLTTNATQTSTADTSKLGDITATTLSATGDGIYILTSKPSVWFYRFDTDSLAEQNAGLGQWPAAKAIASYAGNLYLLGDDVIYKHVRTYSGFSPKSEYLAASATNGLAGANAMTVDGAVYTISSSGLRQYLSGALKANAEAPSSLTSTRSLRSTAGGNTIVATAPGSKRIGFWDATQKLEFSKQYELNGIKALYDATYDAKTKTAYALVDGRLVKFTP